MPVQSQQNTCRTTILILTVVIQVDQYAYDRVVNVSRSRVFRNVVSLRSNLKCKP